MITEQKISATYDAVIIGAGNGGLAAAAQLAIKGAKVLLLEQHNLPGGFATSFVRGRFEFEASLHELCDYGPKTDKGGVRDMFEDSLNLDAEFVEVPEAFRLILTDPEEKLDIIMPFGIDNFLDAIENEVPGSRESVKKFFDLGEDIFNATVYMGQTKGNPDQKVLMQEHSNFLKTTPYSVEEVQNTLNIPEKARKILNAYWVYLGIPTSKLNFTIYAIMTYLYLRRKAYVPKNRSHEYTTALDAKIRQFGGKIEYKTRVEKILVENGKIVGVETSNGDHIKTNHVISNASPTLVYNKLIYPKSAVPEIAYKEVNARTHAVSGFVVYLGLNATVKELGLKDYNYFIYNNMNTEEQYESMRKLETPKFQAAICLNNAIPDCSPPGTSIVSITTSFRPGAWDRVKPEDYFKLKNKIADDLIVNFEKATGVAIRDHIEEIEIATPQTWSRYTGTYNGIIYGYEPEPWDSFVPRLMSMKDEKYIEGLEFAGAWGKRCHGYSSSLKDGETAGLLTLQDLIQKGELK